MAGFPVLVGFGTPLLPACAQHTHMRCTPTAKFILSQQRLVSFFRPRISSRAQLEGGNSDRPATDGRSSTAYATFSKEWSCAAGEQWNLDADGWTMGPMRDWPFRLLQVHYILGYAGVPVVSSADAAAIDHTFAHEASRVMRSEFEAYGILLPVA